MGKMYSFFKPFLKILGFICSVTLALMGMISFFIAVSSQEQVFHSIQIFINNIFNNTVLSRMYIFVTFFSIITASVICVVLFSKIYTKISSEYIKNNEYLQRITTLLDREKNLGIISITARSQYTNDKYTEIFNASKDGLIISGHSLKKTIDTKKSSNLRNEFKTTVVRLIKAERPVKILLLKPNDVTELVEKRKYFISFIKEVYDEMKKKKIPNKTIQKFLLIKEADVLPYYVVKNENVFHIAHYTFGELPGIQMYQNDLFMFEAEPHSEYSEYWYKDFSTYFDKTANFIENVQNILQDVKHE